MLLPETSAGYILLARARRLRKITGNPNIRSQSEIDLAATTKVRIERRTSRLKRQGWVGVEQSRVHSRLDERNAWPGCWLSLWFWLLSPLSFSSLVSNSLRSFGPSVRSLSRAGRLLRKYLPRIRLRSALHFLWKLRDSVRRSLWLQSRRSWTRFLRTSRFGLYYSPTLPPLPQVRGWKELQKNWSYCSWRQTWLWNLWFFLYTGFFIHVWMDFKRIHSLDGSHRCNYALSSWNLSHLPVSE